MKEYIPQLIATGITLVLLPILRYVIGKIITKSGRVIQMNEPRMQQVKRALFVLLNILFVFTIAIIWGVQPNNLLLGLSSVFAMIGVAFFAQWSVLSNITAGIIMFFTAPFRVGDSIRIVDKDTPIVATIENIQTFYTHIRTEEDELIVIPNSLFLQKIVSVKKGNGNKS